MINDARGIEDLPLRFVVTLIVGGAVLGSIIYYMTSICWNKEEMNVLWTPELIEFEDGKNIYRIEFNIRDSNGNGIKDANVIVSGLGGIASGKTADDGKVAIDIEINLPTYRNEGYLDIDVRAGGCYAEYHHEDAIKVVRK